MKVSHRIILYTALFATVLCILSAGVSAEGTPKLYAEATPVADNGVFELNISLENVNFVAYGIAFKFDMEAVAPCTADGEAISSFGEFSSLKRYENFNFIGEKADFEKGYFTYTSFITPGASEGICSDGEAAITEKTLVATFRFKKISDKSPSFDIASIYNGGVYDEMFPDGAAFTAKSGTVQVQISISAGGETKETQSVKNLYAQTNPANYTKEARLENTLYLVDGDYAAAYEGALKLIDTDKNVMPYTDGETRFLPLRFVCETFGAQVGWNDEARTAEVVSASGKKTSIKVDEKTANVGGNEISADIRLEHSRTMVPEELIKEILEINSYKNENNPKECILYGGIVTWQPEREAETEALQAMKYVMMPLFRNFI